MKVGKFNNSIGIVRDDLPQIEDQYHDTILQLLKDAGIKYEIGSCPCSKLSPSQKDLSIDKVNGMIDSGKYKEDRTIFVSKDGYIIDGHHGWAAKYTVDPEMKINVIKVDMNPIDLILWLKDQDFTYSRNVMESK